MRYVLLIIFLLMGFINSRIMSQTGLSRVCTGNKFGFIDSTGKIIVEPKFYNALDFSEGLAPARLTGKFGYIDFNGEFVILPKYDYAEVFKNGTAVVYLNGVPGLLKKDLSELFFDNYKSVSFFNDNFAYIKTVSDKMGVINAWGKLVVDTVYKYIDEFLDGLAVVTGFNVTAFENTADGDEERMELGVIDTTGKVIVPFNKYWRIKSFERDCFNVNWYSDDFKDYYEGFLNREGKLILQTTSDMFDTSLENNINDSVFVMNYFNKEKANGKMSSEFCYKGIVDSKGKVIAVNKEWESIWPINKQISQVRNDNNDNILIDPKGKILFEDKYDGYKSCDRDDIIIVYKQPLSGLIDSEGNIIIPLQDKLIQPDNLGKNYFIFNKYDKVTEEYMQGLADFRGNTVIVPGFYQFMSADYTNGLISAIEKDDLLYFNRSGEMVWERSVFDKNTYLNIDHLRRGDFYIDKETPVQTMTSTNSKFSGKNDLSIFIDPADTVVYDSYFKGLNLYFLNPTDSSINLETQDSRLYIKLQAKNDNGNWKDIDHLPNSFCGNSYYAKTLKAKSFINFPFPIFEGEQETPVRAKFIYLNPDGKLKFELISNEIICGINPGQFWRKEEYYRGGVMDPYTE